MDTVENYVEIGRTLECKSTPQVSLEKNLLESHKAVLSGLIDGRPATENGTSRIQEATQLSLGVQNLTVDCEVFNDSWICAICLEGIPFEEYSQVKGCEHSYCVSCILKWASVNRNPWCPQCRNDFSMLYLYRTLDGRPSDYLVEEPVCLLTSAAWYKNEIEIVESEADFFEDCDDEEEEVTYSNLRISNRRLGENGFVRSGRMEAGPVRSKCNLRNKSGSSRESIHPSHQKASSSGDVPMGRRARRTQLRKKLNEQGLQG